MGKLTVRDRLSRKGVESALGQLPGWALAADSHAISKRLTFSDFREAFRFMTEMADYAEQVNHHPEWCNVWNRVDMKLTTHTANGVTDLDLAFASKVEAILHGYSVACNLSDEECGGCR